jgi:hypothetical protein
LEERIHHQRFMPNLSDALLIDIQRLNLDQIARGSSPSLVLPAHVQRRIRLRMSFDPFPSLFFRHKNVQQSKSVPLT